MKTCSKCQIEKDYSCFYNRKKSKDGLMASCKACFTPQKPLSNKIKLTRRTSPDLDKILHSCAVVCADELTSLNDKSAGKPLSTQEISKMRTLIDILLNLKKKVRPIKGNKVSDISSEDVFG